MTLFIRKADNPDLVRRIDDVISIRVDYSEKLPTKSLGIIRVVKGRKVYFTEQNVISVESN